ncbi:hypothetical protein JRQ81_005943, partial [Phrynocephalus forsythii]
IFQDSKATQQPNLKPHAICEQESADGLQDDSTEVEMSTQTDSQLSSMETEESLTTQEEATKEEKAHIPEEDATNQDSKGEEKVVSEGAEQGQEKQTPEPVEAEGPCDTENISSSD